MYKCVVGGDNPHADPGCVCPAKLWCAYLPLRQTVGYDEVRQGVDFTYKWCDEEKKNLPCKSSGVIVYDLYLRWC